MVIVKTIVDFLFQFLSYMYAFNKIHFWFDLLEHFWFIVYLLFQVSIFKNLKTTLDSHFFGKKFVKVTVLQKKL